MIEKFKDNRILIIRVLACIMAIFLTTGFFVMQGFAKDEHEDDFSFYRVASAAATYYDQTHNDKKDNDNDITKFSKDAKTVDKAANIGVAGNLLGFVDEDFSKGLFGATVSKLSASSQSRSYMSFRGNEDALLAYVQYGHALQSLGLDGTGNIVLDILTMLRLFSGGLLILAYSLAVMVPTLFKGILTLLQGLNPFAWFLGSDAINVPFHDWFASASSSMPDALAGVQTIVSKLYANMSAIGLLMIPVFFVVMIASIILFRAGKGGSGESVLTKIRKYVTRVVFILAGIPILGASYTACLDALLSGRDNEAFSVSTSAANDVVGSTLVDFESWAVNKRLALPAGTKITMSGAKSAGGYVDTGGTTDLRVLARNINAMSNPNLTTPTSSESAMNGAVIGISDASGSTTNTEILAAYDVMLRYMLKFHYKASDLETQYKAAKAGKKVKVAGKKKNFYKWVETDSDSDKYESLMDLIEYDSDVDNYNDNNKLAGDPIGKTGPYMNDNSSGALTAAIDEGAGSITYTGSGKGKGLSTLGMYNYLTSEFTSSSLITHSDNKVAAIVMSHAHHSVSAIGTGAVRTLYAAYAIVMLFVMAIIGFGYALAVLFAMFRRGIAMVTSVPFALMGNFRAMSKVTTIVAMMIIELIGTVFIYQVVIYFLTHIVDIFMIPVYKTLDGPSSAILPILNAIGIPAATTTSFGGQALQIGALSLAIIILVAFGFKAMKLRKSFVKTMDEMAASMVDRIFSPGGVGAGGAGAAYASKPTFGDKVASGAKMAAGAAGTGLAMAGANNLMQGKPLFGGLSKGDAALAGGKVEDGTLEGDEFITGGNGIEGGDQQGLPNPNDPNNPDGPNGLSGGGGSLEEQTGQKLLSGDSLSDNTDKISGEGGASQGESGTMDGQPSDLSADGQSQTLSESADKVNDPMAKATGENSALDDEKHAEATSELRKDGAKQTASGAKEAKGAKAEAAKKVASDNNKAGKQSGASKSADKRTLQSQAAGYGSKVASSMGHNEASATVSAADAATRQFGNARAGQRVVQMSEGKTNSKQYMQQAKQHRNAAKKMYAAVKAAPNASSYSFGNVTYDKAGLIAGARKHEYEASLREQAVNLRQKRASAAKMDKRTAKTVNKALKKTLSSKKPDGYV